MVSLSFACEEKERKEKENSDALAQLFYFQSAAASHLPAVSFLL